MMVLTSGLATVAIAHLSNRGIEKGVVNPTGAEKTSRRKPLPLAAPETASGTRRNMASTRAAGNAQSLATLGDGGNVSNGNPPQAVMRFVELFEPLRAVAERNDVVGGVNEIPQGLKAFPDRHVDGHQRIVIAIWNVGGVADF
jgi:hypothetical protein